MGYKFKEATINLMHTLSKWLSIKKAKLQEAESQILHTVKVGRIRATMMVRSHLMIIVIDMEAKLRAMVT